MTKWLLTIGFWLLAVSACAQPKGVELDTLKVQHIDFQGQPQQGIIICNKKIALQGEISHRAHPSNL